MSRLKVGEERVWLLRWAAIAFAVNKFLVVAITVAGSREQWGPLSPLGFLDYVFIRNFRYFDSHWFTEIAAHGYTVKSTAFFPLYPLVIRGVSELLHVSPLAAGVLISNVAFFFGLYFFLRLARLDLDRTGAVRTLFLLALFPTAFFFSSAYTEALFLLLAALALYSMRARRWGRAGGYSALAAITRNTGIALGLPFLIEYWESWREKKKTLLEAEETGVDEPAGSAAAGGSEVAGSVAAQHRIPWGALWVLLIGVGVAIYLGYLWWTFGNPFIFLQAEEQYGRGSQMPWSALVRGYVYNLGWLFDTSRPLNWTRIYYITQLFFPTVAVVVLVTSFRKLRWSYWVMILYSIVIPLSAPADVKVIDYFVGFSRYMLLVLPLFLGLERLLKRRWAFWIYLAISTVLLLLFTYASSRHKVVA